MTVQFRHQLLLWLLLLLLLLTFVIISFITIDYHDLKKGPSSDRPSQMNTFYLKSFYTSVLHNVWTHNKLIEIREGKSAGGRRWNFKICVEPLNIWWINERHYSWLFWQWNMMLMVSVLMTVGLLGWQMASPCLECGRDPHLKGLDFDSKGVK